jgi:hypothetical protein
VVPDLEVSPLRYVNEGFAMTGSFEWMELQTLTSDINASRSRLAAARASKDNRLTRAIEAEITAAEARRDQLLAHITSHLADAEEAAPKAEATEATDSAPAASPVEEALPDEDNAEQPSGELVDETPEHDIVASATAPKADRVEGGSIVWDQLTPSDIERAQNDIGVRRAEILARHAEELKSLEADQAELESLERAIDAFLRRFNAPAPEADVVKLGEERELRVQNRG